MLTMAIHKRAPKAIQLYCDNKLAVDIANAVKKANRTTFTSGGVINVLMVEYDVIQRLAMILDDAPSQSQVIHIIAHQENNTPAESLSVPESLNVMAHQLATRPLQEGSGTTKAGMIPGIAVLVHTTKGTITRRMAKTARYDKGLEEMQQHIQKQNKWRSETMASIDWEQHSALLRRHRDRVVQVTKLTHKLVPTNTVQYRYKLTPEPTCLLCTSEPETMYHVVQCKHGTRTERRRKLEQQLTEVGKKQSAPPDIVQAFITEWSSWAANEAVQIPDEASTAIQTAMKQQTEIKWHQLLHRRAPRLGNDTDKTTPHSPTRNNAR